MGCYLCGRVTWQLQTVEKEAVTVLRCQVGRLRSGYSWSKVSAGTCCRRSQWAVEKAFAVQTPADSLTRTCRQLTSEIWSVRVGERMAAQRLI